MSALCVLCVLSVLVRIRSLTRPTYLLFRAGSAAVTRPTYLHPAGPGAPEAGEGCVLVACTTPGGEETKMGSIEEGIVSNRADFTRFEAPRPTYAPLQLCYGVWEAKVDEFRV